MTSFDYYHRILRLLTVKKRGAKYWQCLCPAHEDRNPSCSVFIGDTGWLCFRCHRGCSTLQICEALGIPRHALGPPWEDFMHDSCKVVSEHVYTDAQNCPLRKIVRKEKLEEGRIRKTFTVMFYTDEGAWAFGDNNSIPQVPYSLHLFDRPGWLLVVEGEKCADLLNNYLKSGAATSSIYGAKKWRPCLNKYFEGREVCIIPDNDEPGREHAQQVYQELAKNTSKIGILDLPGIGEGEDVEQFIQKFPTPRDGVTELGRLLISQPWYHQRAPNFSKFVAKAQGLTKKQQIELAIEILRGL